jgi:hypothetical protein
MARYIPTNQPPFIRTTTTHKAILYYQPINIIAVGILFRVSLFVIMKQARLAVLLCGKSPIRILVGTSDMLIGFVSTLSFTSHVPWWCYVVPRLLSSKSFSPGRTPTDTVLWYAVTASSHELLCSQSATHSFVFISCVKVYCAFFARASSLTCKVT